MPPGLPKILGRMFTDTIQVLCSSRIKTLKHSRMVDFFQVLFYCYCDLENYRWVKKGAFIIQRNQNISSIETIETIDSLVHHDCRCFIFAIAALISRLIGCYSLTLFTITFLLMY